MIAVIVGLWFVVCDIGVGDWIMGDAMNREQLDERIEKVCEDFKGQFSDLLQMVGIVVIGRLFGWRVIRLVVSRRIWMMTTRAFGDPKLWMPERGRLAYKSVGLRVVDALGGYWDFIKGVTPRDGLSEMQRKLIS